MTFHSSFFFPRMRSHRRRSSYAATSRPSPFEVDMETSEEAQPFAITDVRAVKDISEALAHVAIRLLLRFGKEGGRVYDAEPSDPTAPRGAMLESIAIAVRHVRDVIELGTPLDLDSERGRFDEELGDCFLTTEASRAQAEKNVSRWRDWFPLFALSVLSEGAACAKMSQFGSLKFESRVLRSLRRARTVWLSVIPAERSDFPFCKIRPILMRHRIDDATTLRSYDGVFMDDFMRFTPTHWRRWKFRTSKEDFRIANFDRWTLSHEPFSDIMWGVSKYYDISVCKAAALHLMREHGTSTPILELFAAFLRTRASRLTVEVLPAEFLEWARKGKFDDEEEDVFVAEMSRAFSTTPFRPLFDLNLWPREMHPCLIDLVRTDDFRGGIAEDTAVQEAIFQTVLKILERRHESDGTIMRRLWSLFDANEEVPPQIKELVKFDWNMASSSSWYASEFEKDVAECF